MNKAHRVYLALAGMAFGLHALFLAIIPTQLRVLEADPFWVNAGVGLYAGIGLLSDLPAGHLAQRLGGRTAILAGVTGAMAATAVLYFSSKVALALAMAVLIGLFYSFILTPVIVGVTITADAGSQVRAQSVNAALQRLGALLATVFLLRLGSPEGLPLAYTGVLLVSSTMFASSWKLPALVPQAAPSDGRRGSVRVAWAGSPLFRAGVLVNLTTLVLLVYVGSLVLPVFALVEEDHAFGSSLMAREVVCIGAAIVLILQPRLDLARLLWVSGAVASAVGLAAAPLLVGITWHLGILALGVGGVALGAGIVLANTLMHFGLDASIKYVGFALSSVFNKGLALLFPLLLGALGAEQREMGGFVAGGLILMFVALTVMHAPRALLRGTALEASGR